MCTHEEISENLTAQVCELETLQSVYPKEIVITDHGVLADIHDFFKNPTQDFPHRLEYSVEISLSNGTIELLVSLPPNYPNDKPEIYARNSLLNRIQQLQLNKALKNVVENQEPGEPCIYMLILWLQDNGEDYLVASNENQEKELTDISKDKEEKSITFARYWIYSHHIYGKSKRKGIIDLAKENSITGFCLAGKPGIICMEGVFEDCDYCWQKIKSMNWQKILIRLLENEENHSGIDSIRKFSDFREISFPTSERHNDMGQVLKYLKEHEVQYAFKELFGIEALMLILKNDPIIISRITGVEVAHPIANKFL